MNDRSYGNEKKYRDNHSDAFFHSPLNENFKRLINDPKDSYSKNNNDKEDWEKLKEILQFHETGIVFDEDTEVWYYAQVLMHAHPKLDYFEAMEAASERIGKIRSDIERQYPYRNQKLKDKREKEYFSRLHKIFSKERTYFL